MLRALSRLFNAFWPLGLFVFFVMLVLSFETVSERVIAQIFGMVVVFCAALAWLIADWVKPSQNRVNKQLSDMAELLKPYEGLSLKQMPPEVRAEVHRRLGWTEPATPQPKEEKAG